MTDSRYEEIQKLMKEAKPYTPDACSVDKMSIILALRRKLEGEKNPIGMSSRRQLEVQTHSLHP